MPETLADRFHRWLDYEKDSHAKVLASLNTVPDALRSAPAFLDRGQITLLIRSLGTEPAVTDFVFWTRESIPPRG